MKKNNYFLNFFRSYRNIFFKVLYFEIFYSIYFKELLPKIKIQNSSTRTDTVPCVYYFLHEISKFIKKNDIKSIIDIGSGYGRVVNFISLKNKIKCYGIEYDKEVHKYALKIKKRKVNLYCGNVLTFNIKKLKSKCFILFDPFKTLKDNKEFLYKVKKIYPKKKKYIISINNSKEQFSREFKLVHSIIGSKTRKLKIFEIN